MIAGRCAFILLLGVLLSGCALKKSIQQRVAISEQCRVVTSALPISWDTSAPLASIYLGNLGSCNITRSETSLSMCSLEQIGSRLGLLQLISPRGSDIEKAIQPELVSLRGAVSDLRDKLDALADSVKQIDATYQKDLKNIHGNYKEVTDKLTRIDENIKVIPAQLLSVRYSLEKLRQEIQKLEAATYSQARLELAAWDANLRMQLAQFERFLAGDIQLVLRAGLRNQTLTHVGRRSLELLHGALKPANVVLNKLDDKAYGAVSLGYLAFSPNIQDAVNNAADNLESIYVIRKNGKSNEKKDRRADLEPFLTEVRRAACENLVQGDQFTMLSELADTMLITRITDYLGDSTAPRQHDSGSPPISAAHTDDDMAANRHAVIPSTERSGRGSSTEEAMLPEKSALAHQAGTDTEGKREPVISPLSVYMANEWMARQQLLVKKMSADSANPSVSNDKKTRLPDIVQIDEASVRQIADAATATVIDDIARIQPALLSGQAPESSLLASHINVATSAAAVSNASVALEVNFKVSNTNTFNPTNYIAPVINVPGAVIFDRPDDLCKYIGIAAYGANCSGSGDVHYIAFTDTAFRSDSCDPSDLQPVLGAVGRTLATYRAKYGVQYYAVVQGFASLPPARMAKCRVPQASSKIACEYANQRRNTVRVQGCDSSRAERNRMLSAARATAAAAVLERTAQGAVTVTEVVARGTDTVPVAPNERPASLDQTVLIQLISHSGR